MKKKTRQITAVIALAVFILFTVLGTVGLVISYHHTCNGIHCHTCERITILENTVNIIKTALILLVTGLLLGQSIKLSSVDTPPKFDFNTNIALKTRLNN